jgi:hypothetical protein
LFAFIVVPLFHVKVEVVLIRKFEMPGLRVAILLDP